MLKFGRFQGIGGLIQINNGAYFMEGMYVSIYFNLCMMNMYMIRIDG
jgi:hypothetical protein